MIKLIPVIRVGEPYTWQVFGKKIIGVIVVALQEFISKTTSEPNMLFNTVVAAGGLHKYLSFNGTIILSLVMRDKHIVNFTPIKYAPMINSLKPTFWTTVDGETYELEYARSKKEIERCFQQTKELQKLCPDSRPIGQIKGCSRRQIRYHCRLLKSIGIQDFMLHTGDFLRNSDKNMISIAKGYAEEVRREGRTLILYGMGSPRRFLEFSFADAFITFKHFVAATHGIKLGGVQKLKSNAGYTASLIFDNFVELQKCIGKINKQKKLITSGGVCEWEAVQEAEDQPMLQAEAMIAALAHT